MARSSLSTANMSRLTLLAACVWSLRSLSSIHGAAFVRRDVGRRADLVSLIQSRPGYHLSTQLFGRGRGKSHGGGIKKQRVAKETLPEKICVVCGRPFAWRKKWERCWDEVTCCSKSCNAKRRSEKIGTE